MAEPIFYSSMLPEPTPLASAALVEFVWGPHRFELLCFAAAIRKEKWETGEQIEWLHCKAVQCNPHETDLRAIRTVLIPTSYITRIEPDPARRTANCSKTDFTSVFTPDKPTPPQSLGTAAIAGAINDLTTPTQ